MPVFGICGGYQMLGEYISDPESAEGGDNIRGMGLLKTSTVFSREKTRLRTSGKFAQINGAFSALSGLPFEGYEIHMGNTGSREMPLLELNSDHSGAVSDNICGCYIHGIFDNDEVCSALVKMLCERRGIEFSDAAVSRADYKKQQFDILANKVRSSLDMELVYKILNDQ